MSHNGKALLAAAISGLLVIGGVHWWNRSDDDPDNPRAGCPTVVVTASVEKAALMAEVAKRYNASDRKVNGSCYGISVDPMASGLVESRLARPAGTRPGGRRRMPGRLRRPRGCSCSATTARCTTGRTSCLRSRVRWSPRRSSSPCRSRRRRRWVGPTRRSAGRICSRWPTIRQGWASKGHPEWGAFKLGKTNPNVSTSGLSATIGAFVAATGTSSDLTLDTVKDPRVRDFVAGVEKSVAHYGDTALTFLANLQRADDAGAALGYVSAVAVEEKSVVDYNAGNPTGDLETVGQHGKPRVPLVAVYPKEGTLDSDSPFAVLQAPWSDAGKQSAAEDFLAYLHEPAAQELFTAAGFRTFDGRPGKAITDSEYLADDVGVVLSPPSPPVLAAIRAAWTELRKPARVLLVLDVSGSMGASAGGGQDPAGTRQGRGGERTGPAVRRRRGRAVDVSRGGTGRLAAHADRAARPAAAADDHPHPAAHPVGRHAALFRDAEGVRGDPSGSRRRQDQRDRGDDRRYRTSTRTTTTSTG